MFHQSHQVFESKNMNEVITQLTLSQRAKHSDLHLFTMFQMYFECYLLRSRKMLFVQNVCIECVHVPVHMLSTCANVYKDIKCKYVCCGVLVCQWVCVQFTFSGSGVNLEKSIVTGKSVHTCCRIGHTGLGVEMMCVKVWVTLHTVHVLKWLLQVAEQRLSVVEEAFKTLSYRGHIVLYVKSLIFIVCVRVCVEYV